MMLHFEALDETHDLTSFDSGENSLDHWLRRYAFANQSIGSSRTYVAVDTVSNIVVGYYSLTVASVDHADVPAGVGDGMPPAYPVPVVLLARLAVDQKHHGERIGTALLGDALVRTLQVADLVGVRALLVHTLNDNARSWYLSVAEFETSPTHERHLLLSLRDIESADAQS